jgi:hypothetical protein
MCLTKRREFVRYFQQSYCYRILTTWCMVGCMLTWYAVQVLTLLQFGGYTFVRNSSDLFRSFGFTSKPVLIGLILFQVTLMSSFVLSHQSTDFHLHGFSLPFLFSFLHLNFFASWSFAFVGCGLACLLSSGYCLCLCWLFKYGFICWSFKLQLTRDDKNCKAHLEADCQTWWWGLAWNCSLV